MFPLHTHTHTPSACMTTSGVYSTVIVTTTTGHCLASHCVHLVLCTVLHSNRFYLDPMTGQITVCSYWLTDIDSVYSLEGLSHNVMIVCIESPSPSPPSLSEYDCRALCVARYSVNKTVCIV